MLSICRCGSRLTYNPRFVHKSVKHPSTTSTTASFVTTASRANSKVNSSTPASSTDSNIKYSPTSIASNTPSSQHEIISDGTRFYRRMENQMRLDQGIPPLADLISQYDPAIADGNTKSFPGRISNIVELLKNLSNNDKDLSLPEVPLENQLYRRPPTKFEIPKYPNKWNADSLREYIREITDCEYKDNKHSYLVQLILKDLLMMSSVPQTGSHSTETYNLAIAYFLRLRNLRPARELYDRMTGPVHPNLDTYKLFLLSVRQRWKNGYHEDPLAFVLKILKDMSQHRGLEIDAEVWNIVMISMPDASSKTMILDAMQKQKIPLSRRGLATIVKDVTEIMGPLQAIDYLTRQTAFQVTIESVNFVIQRMITLDKIKAWRYLHLALNKWNLKPNTATINMILETMVKSQRLDRMIGVLSALESFGALPNTRTFQLLFKAAVNRQFHPHKYENLRLIYALWCQAGFDRKRRYYKQLADLQSQFYMKTEDCSVPLELVEEPKMLDSDEQLLWDQYKEAFRWGGARPRLHFDSSTAQSKSHQLASQILGYDVVKLHPKNKSGSFKFYRIRHKAQWTDFLREKRGARLECAKLDEHMKRQNIVKQGPHNSFLSDLVREGIIDDD